MLPIWCSLLCEMIESNSINQRELRQASIHQTLYKLLRHSASIDEPKRLKNSYFRPTSVLNVLLRLASDDSPNLGQDVAALLELLQKQDFTLQFKQNLLETLIEMMRRNYRVKDLWREKSGYETASALLLSLDSKLNEIELSDEEKLRECIVLVKYVFTAFSISMSGSHLSNRLYMRTNKQYESIASTCKLIGLFGTKYDIQLVDMVSNCATEINDLDWPECHNENSPGYTIKLQNPDPFAILVDEIDSLSRQGLDRLLKVFLVLFGWKNKERIANCDLFLSDNNFSRKDRTNSSKLDLDIKAGCDMALNLLRRLEPMLLNKENSHHKKVMTFFELLLSHRISPQCLIHIVRLIYKTVPGHSDILENSCTGVILANEDHSVSTVNGLTLLQLLDNVASEGNSRAVYSHIQMVGVHDKVLAASHSVPKALRRLKGEVQRSASSLSEGNVSVAGLEKFQWPPVTGYSFSLWVWLGQNDVTLGKENTENAMKGSLNLYSVRNETNFCLLCVHLIHGQQVIRCKMGSPSGTRERKKSAFSATFLTKQKSRRSEAEINFSLPREHLKLGWHHMLLVHRPEKLLDKSAGGMTIFWDGIHVATHRCSYLSQSSSRAFVLLGSNKSDLETKLESSNTG